LGKYALVDLQDGLGDPFDPDVVEIEGIRAGDPESVVEFVKEPRIGVVLSLEEILDKIAEFYVGIRPQITRDETQVAGIEDDGGIQAEMEEFLIDCP
jgi:hypothetical protein